MLLCFFYLHSISGESHFHQSVDNAGHRGGQPLTAIFRKILQCNVITIIQTCAMCVKSVLLTAYVLLLLFLEMIVLQPLEIRR